MTDAGTSPDAGTPPGSVSAAEWFALRRLSEEYAAGADHRDGARYAAAFVPDGHLYVHDPADGPALRQRHGSEALAAVPGMLERYDLTFHFIGNCDYAIDGDRATGQVSCIAHHVRRAEGTDYVMHIRYGDVYVRTPAGWLIDERHCRVLFTETRPIDA